jgi:glutamate--cysteine ligase
MSLDRAQSPDFDAPIEGFDDLVAYFRKGEKPRERWRVGTEHEKIGLGADLRPVPYPGERGIGSLLRAMAAADGSKMVSEGENVVALESDGASVTLEPGGQLELSGAPLATIHETCAEFHAHLELLRRVSEPRGIVWLGLGRNPLYGVEGVPSMPKERYRIMREYLPRRGSLALEMMHLTATVQANFDYADEADMARKLRTAMSVTPIVSAVYANSSLADGKASGFVSQRMHVWRNTDPDRTGLLPFVFREDFGYADYARWALEVPMFFIVREGRYLPLHGKPLSVLLRDGHDGHRATLADFDRHLTTLFPEVRLKRFIEVRGADAVPPALTCSLPALWKGILYDADALQAAGSLAAPFGLEEREAALLDVARRGLGASFGRHAVLDLARELVGIADSGLRRQARDTGIPDETAFLDPVREQIHRGVSPGQEILECWEGEWARSPARLIEHVRY